MQNTDQLKMILEAIGSTTDSAKWALIAWLGFDVLKTIVCWTGGLLLAKIGFRQIFGLIGEHAFARVCRDTAVPDQAGTVISDGEKRQVLQMIQLGVEARACGWKPESSTNRRPA